MRGWFAAFVWLGAALAQDAVPPVQLPADWAQRDLEGKWVSYRAAVDGAPDQPGVAAAWAAALGRAREIELLEWIALFEGWRVAGPELVRLDPPQLLRAAAWNVTNFDSHGQTAAKKVLLDRAARVLGWLQAHADAVRGPLRDLQQELVDDGVQPARDPNDLPPHDAMQVLVPWLDAPASLVEFGTRTTAEPRVRYVHQVVRALRGVLVHGDAGDLVLTKVVGLTRHADAVVRHQAFDTLAKLPAGHVPFLALQKIVDDESAGSERRRLATMALSFSSHPEVGDVLVRLSLDRAHPGQSTALVRFGEIGDPVAAVPLSAAAATSPELAAAVAPVLERLEQRRRERAFAQGQALRLLLQRAAWLQVRGDPRFAATWASTLQLVQGSAAPAELAQVVGALQNQPSPASPLRGDEAGKLERAVQERLRELQASVAPAGDK